MPIFSFLGKYSESKPRPKNRYFCQKFVKSSIENKIKKIDSIKNWIYNSFSFPKNEKFGV